MYENNTYPPPSATALNPAATEMEKSAGITPIKSVRTLDVDDTVLVTVCNENKNLIEEQVRPQHPYCDVRRADKHSLIT